MKHEYVGSNEYCDSWKVVSDLKDKYIKRLADAGKNGFRCCLIDSEDKIEVQKIFFNDDHYYFTEQEGEMWLNWE